MTHLLSFILQRGHTSLFLTALLACLATPAVGGGPSAGSFGAYARGLALRAEGDVDGAARAFSEALTADSTAGAALIALAETYATAGRDSELIEAVRRHRAAAGSRDSVAVMLLLAGAHARRGETQETVQVLTRVVQAHPDSASFHVLLGQAYAERGETRRAVDEYVTALRHSPQDPDVLSALGSALANTDSLDAARTALERSLELDPDQPGVELALGGVEQRSERFEEALRHYERVLTFLPGDPATQFHRSECLAALGRVDEAAAVLESLRGAVRSPVVIERRLAVLYWRSDRPKLARRHALALQKADPTDPLPSEILGYLAMDEGRAKEAEKLFRTSLSLAPRVGTTQLALGVALIRQRRHEEATGILREAIANGADRTAALYFCGVSLLARGDTAAAVDTFHLANRTDSLQSGAAYALAQVADARGDRAAAASWMRRVIAVDSTNASAWNYVGYMQADAGVNLEEALRQIEHALSMEPENSAFLDSYGWVLFRMGRFEEARVALEKAAKRAPKEGEILEHLGDAYAQLGRTEDARRAYTRAARATPARPRALDKLRDLDRRARTVSGNR